MSRWFGVTTAYKCLASVFLMCLCLQAKRYNAAAGSIAAQVGLLSAGQPPLEAAPTPQGYAQRQALMQGQNQSQNQAQAHATMEAAGGQDSGQVQSLMDQSRARGADIEGVVDDGGGGGAGVGGGLSDQQRQPIKLSQVRFLLCFCEWSGWHILSPFRVVRMSNGSTFFEFTQASEFQLQSLLGH